MNNGRLKFRVWDNLNRRYCKDLPMIDKDGDLCYEDGHKYCNGEHPEDFTIEQCTGLRDRNGKLIYEGDVVFVYNPLTDAQNACVVKWVDNKACYICEYLHPDYVQRGCEFASATGTYLDGSHCEIGGNIHEVKQ